ncbi:hypothetical protein [Nesterenkonia rhizosphaerae]|uniref:Uncharacterized protein n=1 Tax=Nesterenkonia rhizosphaerae TaxID=1348272 RepID=A0ABP9FYL4_9MICC
MGAYDHSPASNTPAVRTIRGVLAASAAVSAAALAHSVAGHHPPHALVILLALAVSIPLSVALSNVALSRSRLAAAVLGSQAVLHGLFELLSASAAVPLSVIDGAHAHHQQIGLGVAPGTAHTHLSAAEPGMAAAHVVAAAGTYLLLRRGEVILHALIGLLSLQPVRLLLEIPAAVPVAPPTASAGWQLWQPLSLWLGQGPRTLRGPPLLVIS